MRKIEQIKADYDKANTLEEKINLEHELKNALFDLWKSGKLVLLPFIAMVERSLRDGKMRPQMDQKHNGRYAVVYVDKAKWGTPLIDICGTFYNTEQAESRRNAIIALEGENKG